MTALRLESDIPRLKSLIAAERARGKPIGFVPTMGGLHQGHCSLIEASRADGCFTVASVFVNPAQFGPNEDFDVYPRDPDGDFAKCEAAGADLVWYPDTLDLYPVAAQTVVTPGPLSKMLCGRSRPKFFGGICTVVLKFFHLVAPDRAYFGEKDFQQLTIIRRMVADFLMDVEVLGCPTMREPDGLAMSSRNARLADKDRDLALTLARTLNTAREAYAAGERDGILLADQLKRAWPERLDLDYLEFREPHHLALSERLQDDTRLFLGAWLDGVRLIDNAPLTGEM
jgi:pantoate--beta-alanine ligase